MIDKIEYGDFNKFLVSTGYLLIAIGLLLPYFYLKESFDLQIEAEKLKDFTLNAQEILNAKQSFALSLIKIIPYLSVISIFLGTIFLIFGGNKWRKKQVIEDEKIKEEISKLKKDNRKADFEFDLLRNGEKLSQEEVIRNKENEIKIEQPTISVNERIISAQSSFLLENLIIEKVKAEYSSRYNVITNFRLNNNEFDIILRSLEVKNIGGLDLSKDTIFEIKYISKQITKRYVLNVLFNVNKLISVYPKAITNPVVIFVRANSDDNFDENLIREEIIDEWSIKTIRKWNLIFTTVKDLPDLKFKNLLNI